MTATERDRLVIVETEVKEINSKLDKVIADHEMRIRCLEGKPGKRWEMIAAVVVTAVLNTGIMLIITNMSK